MNFWIKLHKSEILYLFERKKKKEEEKNNRWWTFNKKNCLKQCITHMIYVRVNTHNSEKKNLNIEKYEKEKLI